MHGGWCWRDVRPRLASAGHRVVAPTLTGHGDRRDALTPAVGVSTHVDDLADALWFEDLRDVHLVLHSYAGILAGPVADRAGDRVASIVYLGAFLTRPGECLLDVEPPETAARYRALAADHGDGWRIPSSTAFLAQWGVTDARLAKWVGPRLTDFPLRCATEPTAFDPAALAAIPQVYVRHTDPPLASLDLAFTRATEAGWDTHDLACGHDMMLAAPSETAALLQGIAGASSA
jgi:pimeloyl-ACP methyl ester carboxylesterase